MSSGSGVRGGALMLAVGAGLFASVSSAGIGGMSRDALWTSDGSSRDSPNRETGARQAGTRHDPTRVFLCQATGDLSITAVAGTETYEVYFHIPVPYEEQVPILVTVESPRLVDYRFLRLDPPNLLVAARMLPGLTSLNWTAWVLVVENDYADLPAEVPIPAPETLPDSVRGWLESTDCAQLDAEIVQQTAAQVRGGTNSLTRLAQAICDYCYGIPWSFPHTPTSFDAVYALNWGNSCTGHAHAGAALFRANGVPARTLMNMPVDSGSYDMHWIIAYFMPEYGWVRMETSTGQNPAVPEQEIVTFACNPQDEFPLFLPCGIEGQWHTSDPALGMMNPNWAGAHSAASVCTIAAPTAQILAAHALTGEVFARYADAWGLPLPPDQAVALQAAHAEQTSALECIENEDLEGYLEHLELAAAHYEGLALADPAIVFFDDCEGGPGGWTHGGTLDEWECGAPSAGPPAAHSGQSCWGTDLDGDYENNADCWLLSPWIDLTQESWATLDFWVWNWVDDRTQGLVYDPLWLDVTQDGVSYLPLSSAMGGVNDDTEIPDVGGWNHVVLDLTKWTGDALRIRFRFRSNATDAQFGPYLDDIRILGRAGSAGGVTDLRLAPDAPRLLPVTPSPARGPARLDFDLPVDARVRLGVFDPNGRRVASLIEGKWMPAGRHTVNWSGCGADASRLPSGIYFFHLETGTGRWARRAVLLQGE